MKTAGAPLFVTISASVLLAGCSLFPGMSFDGSLPAKEVWRGMPERYVVRSITPQLLLAENRERKLQHVGMADPTLAQDIADYNYHVEPRDMLSVIVWGDPAQTSAFTPNGSVGLLTNSNMQSGFKVAADGTVYYPYLGSVRVADQTVQQIRSELASRMHSLLKDPQVTVDIAQFNSQKYELAGSVEKPGLYPITDVPLTVSQAIAAGGGVVHQIQNTLITGNTIPRPLGDLSRVLYLHDGKASLLNLRALDRDGDESQDHLVRAGDVIQVPDNSFEQVHLIGEVRNPGNYPLNDGSLNLAQVIADAGGTDLSTADTARIFVFRGAYQKPEVFWLDASSPDAMLLANEFQLQPQDVVYVATAGLVSWDRVVSQILPTVQTLYETKVLIKP